MRELDAKLLYAVESECLDEAIELIAAGANVNAANENGDTPLHRAVHRGYADIAKALIEAGANTEATDRYGWTPLRWAAYFADTTLAITLLVAGAKSLPKGAWYEDFETTVAIAILGGSEEYTVKWAFDAIVEDPGLIGRTKMDLNAEIIPLELREKLSIAMDKG